MMNKSPQILEDLIGRLDSILEARMFTSFSTLGGKVRGVDCRKEHGVGWKNVNGRCVPETSVEKSHGRLSARKAMRTARAAGSGLKIRKIRKMLKAKRMRRMAGIKAGM